MTNAKIIQELNDLYDEIRLKIPVYGNTITSGVVSEISQMLSKVIGRIERAEFESMKASVMKHD